MSPENARILVAEDDERWQRLYERAVRGSSHTIVLSVSSRQEALERVQEAVDAGINVAIVDGSLPHQGDGEAIAEALRGANPNIKIIAITGMKEKFGDALIWKGAFDKAEFLRTITEL